MGSRFARVEPRLRVATFLQGLLTELPRADVPGDRAAIRRGSDRRSRWCLRRGSDTGGAGGAVADCQLQRTI
jgi:hypothetical protein